MRREERLFKTLTALKTCLQECRQDPNPQRALGDFVSRLKFDPTWQDSEVREVEAAAQRIIQSQNSNDKP
jgi:hypothetical protein